jgi:hypothetical protein
MLMMMMIKWDMNVYGRLPGGIRKRRRRKERILRGEEMEIWYIYTYEDSITKPNKHCLKKERVGEWKCNGESEHVQGVMYNVGMITMKSPKLLMDANSKIIF